MVLLIRAGLSVSISKLTISINELLLLQMEMLAALSLLTWLEILKWRFSRGECETEHSNDSIVKYPPAFRRIVEMLRFQYYDMVPMTGSVTENHFHGRFVRRSPSTVRRAGRRPMHRPIRMIAAIKLCAFCRC